MKLTSYYFNELNEEQQNRIMDNFCENGFNADYLNGKYSHTIVNAQVVVDEDFNLYDIKVFDPYNLAKDAECLPVYIGPSGWSNWLFEYRDNAGNDTDTILEDYDGETQEQTFTYDVEFNDETSSNSKGWHESYQYCKDYIDKYNGTSESYFADYKGGIVSIVCNETESDVYTEVVK